MLELRDETFEGTFPFASNYRAVNGFQMHYVDEGRGEPIVLLHGDPTWGYLYRMFIPPLSQKMRCIVPDHMGMGKSGRPTGPPHHRLADHISNLESLFLGLDLRDITLVIHDWGGPVGLGFAIRHPDRIKRLILLNTWAFAPWPGGPFPRLLALVRSEKGERFVLEKNGYLEAAISKTVIRSGNLTDVVMAAYRAPFPTPDSRLPLLWWSRDIPVGRGDTSFDEMSRIENSLSLFRGSPILIVWGMRDLVLPETVLRKWQRTFPDARTHVIEEAGHFLQEDEPFRIIGLLEDFIESNP